MLRSGDAWHIGAAQAGELAEVRALAERSADGPPWGDSVWKSLLEPSFQAGFERVLLVCRDEQARLLGWVTGTTVGEIAELEFLLVSPEDRQAGIGRCLVRAWLQSARIRGAKEALLEVRKSNQAAQSLYEGVGFHQEQLRPRYYTHPVEDAVLMRMALQG